MDSTLVAGIIGGVSTLVAGFVSPFFTKLLSEKRKMNILPKNTPDRKEAIYGHWEGEIDQKVGKYKKNMRLKLISIKKTMIL